jgi:hypothetical protein
MAQPETILQAAIMAALGAIPGVVVWRNNVGSAMSASAGQRVAYGVGGPGAPDLLCEVCRAGVWLAVWLEVKTATGRLRPEQVRWHEAARAEGRHVAVVRSVGDALEVVRGFSGGEL